MATVHTAYGPGTIVDQETVRGRTQYKVAGDGFEVWLDETKLGGYSPSDQADPDFPDRQSHDPGDRLTSEAFGPDHPDHYYSDNFDEIYDPRGPLQRDRLRTHQDYDGYGDDERTYLGRRLGWAPLNRDNSTTLPYDPSPQHSAVDGPGYDDNSATLQPIHHIDPEERLSPSDSVTLDGEDDDYGDGPGPNPDLFAKEASDLGVGALFLRHPLIQKTIQKILPGMPAKDVKDNLDMAGGYVTGHGVGIAAAPVGRQIERAIDAVGPGQGWGDLIKPASVHEANPAALLPAALRVLGPAAARAIGSEVLGRGVEGLSDFQAGEGWGDLVKDASYFDRPAGLSDKYIDITAGADYHNDPVAQFRHDPDAYINRIGHLMDEGLNPRFAEYMELVEADGGIRTAAWKDVRKKAMRLKREGHVTVKDIAPNRIMASVVGDHGTYDVLILKNGSYGGLNEGNPGHAISNWHCGCEWGRWAFRRKYTYVGRLCSHAYASYLTMQSAALKGKPRQQKAPKRKAPSRALPFLHVKRGSLHTADNLQNGPQRLTPELIVNDTDDAHMFVDVTTDERDDVGPDDVVSEKDIVHFARLMRHCEVTEQPYPRQLVAFLARYAGCNDDHSDDTRSDYQAHDADDADGYLDQIRADGDRKQERDFGSMAERVHEIQDAVEEAREHGVDADRFVASVLRNSDKNSDMYGDQMWSNEQGRWVSRPNYKPTTPQEKNQQMYGDQMWSNEKGDWVSRPKTENNNSSVTPAGPGDSRLDAYGPDGINKNNPGGSNGPHGGVGDRVRNNPETMPKIGPNSTVGQGSGGNAGGKGGGGNAGGYTAPGGGMTTGPVADGGVAGAENGNNSAITKTSPNVDANGMYTVQKGDTWTDIAQRATGDMNNYQKMYDAQGGKAGGNIDSLAEGTQVNLKDFLNDTGNNNVKGDVTNPAGGGPDKNMATQDFQIGITSPSGNTLSTAQGFAGGAPGMAPAADAPAPAAPKTPEPAMQPGGTKASLRTARDWLRWAAEQDGSSSSTNGDGTTNTTAPTTVVPKAGDPATTPGAATPAADATGASSASGQRNPSSMSGIKENDTYDPDNPGQPGTGQNRNDGTQGQQDIAQPQPQQGLSNGAGAADLFGSGLDAASGIASGLGQALPDIASGVGQALPGMAQGIGDAVSGIASGLGSIFASRQDFDDWVRYAYPQVEGEGDLEPHTHPFAGSGYPGPLEFGTSEDYADKARKKHDDVTDLGDDPLSTPMGKWQRQASDHKAHACHICDAEFDTTKEVARHYEENHAPEKQDDDDDRPRRKPKTTPWGERVCEDCGGIGPGSCVCDISKKQSSIGYSTDDDSDIVRTFQKQSRVASSIYEDQHDDKYIDCPSCGDVLHVQDVDNDYCPTCHEYMDDHDYKLAKSTDDDSDIVRTFQAHLGDTALGAGAGQGAGRFDDIAGAAQGFLRTAGRNYSLAEQSELIREGDRGGARNLDSLDLKGTHYEDMHTLGW